MTTEYEYYETGDAQVTQVYGVNWYAQTFTVGASAHTITNVKLKLYRSGLPGTVTVSIRATSGNHPTGSDLTSGTIDGNTITDASPGQFYEIAVTELALSANTKYAVVVRAPSGTDAKYVCWRQNNTGGYSGGNKEESNDSGAVWTSWTAIDFMFEVWETE